MSRKSYSLFVVVIVLAVLALSQLACSGSGGGSDTLRRITFILTNGKRLNEAWEINDFFLGPRGQDLLWRALKEARLQAERNYVIREANKAASLYSVAD